MAERIDPLPEKRGDDPESTGFMQPARPYDFPQRDPFDVMLAEDSLLPEANAPAYRREPLFNKKVMVAWALAAFGVWFAVSYVIPVVFESVKSALVEGVQTTIDESGRSGKVIITRNGKRITITRNGGDGNGVTVTTEPAGTPAPAATPAPVTPAEAAAPVITPAPPAPPARSGSRPTRR